MTAFVAYQRSFLCLNKNLKIFIAVRQNISLLKHRMPAIKKKSKLLAASESASIETPMQQQQQQPQKPPEKKPRGNVKKAAISHKSGTAHQILATPEENAVAAEAVLSKPTGRGKKITGMAETAPSAVTMNGRTKKQPQVAKEAKTAAAELAAAVTKPDVVSKTVKRNNKKTVDKEPSPTLDVQNILAPTAKKARGKTAAKETVSASTNSEIGDNAEYDKQIKTNKRTAKKQNNDLVDEVPAAAAPTKESVSVAAEAIRAPAKSNKKQKVVSAEVVETKPTKAKGKAKKTINELPAEEAAEVVKAKPTKVSGKIKKPIKEIVSAISAEEMPAAGTTARQRKEATTVTTTEEKIVAANSLNGAGSRKRGAAAKIQANENDTKLKKKATQDDNSLDAPAANTVKRKRKGAAEPNENVAAATNGAKAAKIKKQPMNSTASTYNKADFDTGNSSVNYKISSWNVAGLRAWLAKDGLDFLNFEEPHIFCMQETKCTIEQLPDKAARLAGYHPYWLCMPGGHAGVGIYSKIMPIHVEYGIGNEEFDKDGRIITAEYEKFYLINVYVPNSGRKLVNLDARMRWEKIFQQHVQKLDAVKPLIICGDMNVSHMEIDLANPKANKRNAGFTDEERGQMDELLKLGFVDTYRHLYPTRKDAYTYWTYMANARERNVGWRLDYFLVSQRFLNRVVDNCIRTQCMGSDHCPITLCLNL